MHLQRERDLFIPTRKNGKSKSNPEDAPMQDTGSAVVSPTQGDAPAKKRHLQKKFLVTQHKRVKETRCNG